jgi:hypothetical protein
MTYAELIQNLKNLPVDRLNDMVTVYVAGEDQFHAVDHFRISDSENDVLDEGHAFLTI